VAAPFEHRGARCGATRYRSSRTNTTSCPRAGCTRSPCRRRTRLCTSAARATLRGVADLGQGGYGFNRTPAEAREAVDRLERLLAQRGRGLSDVQLSISPYLKPLHERDVGRYRDAGVDPLILLAFAGDRDSLPRSLDQHARLIAEAGR
jgi:hypothetical protein